MNSTPSPIAAALLPFVERRELAGAVALVATRDEVLHHEAVGFADIAAGTPMRPDATFWIASQTKPIAATALMMLVDEGRVCLDDPVEKYLPEFAGQWVTTLRDDDHILLTKPRHPVTVRGILSHTSGLGHFSPMEKPSLDRFSLEVRVSGYAMLPLEYEPGSRYQYSNQGINTAGRIVEVVSGQPFEEFLDERLLIPLGMTDTTFWPDAEQISRLAKCYRPGPDGTGLEETLIGYLHYPLDDRAERFSMPGGGLFSTARDVARFCQMILSGGIYEGRRYVSEDAIREMTSRQTGDLPESYGLGWVVGENSYGHGGALATNMSIDATRGRIYVFLVQHAGFPGEGGKAQEAFRAAVG